MSTPATVAMRPSAKQRRGINTVGPLRDPKDIRAIKGLLADRPRDYAIFVVGIHLGLRACDLLRLRWRYVLALDGRSIGDRVTVQESKTAKSRTMVLQAPARDALAALLRASPSATPDSWVFPSREGDGPVSVQRLSQLIKQWCVEVGVTEKVGTHTLRKTFGYHLRKAGYDITLLQAIFNHSHPAVTRRYLGITQDEINEATLKLSL